MITIRKLVQRLRQLSRRLEVESPIADHLSTSFLPSFDYPLLRPRLPGCGGLRCSVVPEDGFGLDAGFGGRVAFRDELSREEGEREGTGWGGVGEVVVELG